MGPPPCCPPSWSRASVPCPAWRPSTPTAARASSMRERSLRLPASASTSCGACGACSSCGVLSVMPNRALRARVLTVFDQTFQITYALQAIAILVAVLGVIGALTARVLQRGRDIGVLRAIGARRAQVRAMVLVEGGALGLIG